MDPGLDFDLRVLLSDFATLIPPAFVDWMTLWVIGDSLGDTRPNRTKVEQIVILHSEACKHSFP